MNFIRSVFLGDRGSYQILGTPIDFRYYNDEIISLQNAPFQRSLKETNDLYPEIYTSFRIVRIMRMDYLHTLVHEIGHALADYLVREKHLSVKELRSREGFRREESFEEWSARYRRVLDDLKQQDLNPEDKESKMNQLERLWEHYLCHCHDWQRIKIRNKRIIIYQCPFFHRGTAIAGSYFRSSIRLSIRDAAGAILKIPFSVFEIFLATKMPLPFALYLESIAIYHIWYEWGPNMDLRLDGNDFGKIAKRSGIHLAIALEVIFFETLVAVIPLHLMHLQTRSFIRHIAPYAGAILLHNSLKIIQAVQPFLPLRGSRD